jgi:heme o synthase
MPITAAAKQPSLRRMQFCEPALTLLHRNPISVTDKALAFLALSKPRITLLVVLNAAAGFALGVSGRWPYSLMVWTLLATALLSAGVAALTQYLERDRDRLMRRTANRPLPAGKLSPQQVLLFASGLIVLAELIFILLVNWLPALLGAVVVVTYDWIYTPLKTRAWWSTLMGAVPGAIPPVIGWLAVRGRWDAPALVLFSIVFLWQLPHVLAVAMLYRTGYAQAGICLLPVGDRDCALTGWKMAFVNLLLIPVSLLPTLTGKTENVYIFPAIALGIVYLWSTVRLAQKPAHLMAVRLLRVSVLYLPLLLAAIVFYRKGV